MTKKYDKSVWIRYCATNIQFAIKFGFSISMILILSALCLGVFLYTKGSVSMFIRGVYLGLPSHMIWCFAQLCIQIWLLFLLDILCLVLLTIWWGILLGCLYEIYLLVVRIMLKKGGLRKTRDIQYFKFQLDGLQRKFRKIVLIGLTVMAFVFSLVLFVFNAGIWLVLDISFIFTLLLTILLFIISYYYDWRVLKQKDPNIIRVVYGRRSTLGNFFYGIGSMIFLVFVFRGGLPALYSSAVFCSNDIFGRIAVCRLQSPSAERLQHYLQQNSAENNLSKFVPRVEQFSVEWWISGFVKDTGFRPTLFMKRLLLYLYWVCMLLAALSLLMPMILYNLTLSRKNTIYKVLRAAFVSLCMGFGLPYFLSWLFLLPLPSVGTTSFVSMLVFTIYITWVYTK